MTPELLKEAFPSWDVFMVEDVLDITGLGPITATDVVTSQLAQLERLTELQVSYQICGCGLEVALTDTESGRKLELQSTPKGWVWRVN